MATAWQSATGTIAQSVIDDPGARYRARMQGRSSSKGSLLFRLGFHQACDSSECTGAKRVNASSVKKTLPAATKKHFFLVGFMIPQEREPAALLPGVFRTIAFFDGGDVIESTHRPPAETPGRSAQNVTSTRARLPRLLPALRGTQSVPGAPCSPFSPFPGQELPPDDVLHPGASRRGNLPRATPCRPRAG